MEEQEPDVQPPLGSTLTAGLTYVGALVAGVVLVASGHASTAEASGYVAPFLVLYERLASHRPRT